MRYTEENVRAGLRVREGKRKFFLEPGDSLTPQARQWLEREGVEVLKSPAGDPEPLFTTPWGGVIREKPEHMTHLRESVLVPKTHPRICFRGALDSLCAEVLLLTGTCSPEARGPLGEILETLRAILRAEVLEEPLREPVLGGLSARELREESHHPHRFGLVPHFMPRWEDGPLILGLNSLRARIRQGEILACRAFTDGDGVLTRQDLVRAMNRLSSFCWILMLREKTRREGGSHE